MTTGTAIRPANSARQFNTLLCNRAAGGQL